MPELPKWHIIDHLLRAERWIFRKETFLNLWRIVSAFVFTAAYLPISIVAILCTPHKWSARDRGLTGWVIGQYVWTGAILWCTGCTVRVEGYRPDWNKSHVVTPTHTGIFDHIIMGHAVNRGRFVYKSDLRWYPFLGQILILLGQIPINRKKGKDARGRLMRTLKHWSGANVIIYPEGTRTKDGSLGKFKTGAAQMAIAAGVPIIPTVIVGAYQSLSVTEPMLKFRPGEMVVVFGQPIYPNGMTAEQLTRAVYKSVKRMIRKRRAPR